MSGSGRISPTAHYTGYVWARNGLSHQELETLEGRLLYESLRGAMTVSSMLGGPSLERYLLARHRAIDAALEQGIVRDGISQVLEVACGLSPRGWRFSSRHGSELRYVEADLPEMAARKRRALERIGTLSEHHRVVEVDALADTGPLALSQLAASELDPGRGTAIITEGLTGYLDRDALIGMWKRFATVLGEFPQGRYISDLHLAEGQDLLIGAFRLVLSAFVRGRVHLHYEAAAAASEALRGCGFSSVEVLPAGGDRLVHIIEASTTPA